MSPDGRDALHPFLLASFARARRDLVLRQAERIVRLELSRERIEEREYDEERRLRKERTVDRTIVRAEAHERYAEVLVHVHDKNADLGSLHDAISRRLESDLDRAAGEFGTGAGVSSALARYRELLPAEEWPAVLCMVDGPAGVDGLKRRLGDLQVPVHASPLLERLGIVKLSCPPELAMLEHLGGFPTVQSLAAPETPVQAPEVIEEHETELKDVREALGVTDGVIADAGGDATIAVLDTGVDLTHPAFSRLTAADYRNFTRMDDEDADGHGTHVASIAAGHDDAGGGWSGVAAGCRLVIGKVISGTRVGELERVLLGLAWAVFEQRADVVCLSIGDEQAPANGRSIWTLACEEAHRQGVVVCVAAGNLDRAYPETVIVPGDAPTAVTVGAIDRHGRLSPSSAQGSAEAGSPLFAKPNCVGPGVGIVAARSAHADAEGATTGRYCALSGTSMATPAVAGCFALLKSRARRLGWEPTPAELTAIFYGGCRPLRDERGEPYRSDCEVGHGLVDMRQAVTDLERLAGSRTRSGPAATAATRTPMPAPLPQTVSPVTSARLTLTSRPGEMFLNRFEVKARDAGPLQHPLTGAAERLHNRPQSFARRFGDVIQFQSKRGLNPWRASRLVVAAVRIERQGLDASRSEPRPADDLFTQVADGLGFEEGLFYCVGLFSPVGWPAEWTEQVHTKGNAQFYLVSKREGTTWHVFGPDDSVRSLFDPETLNEKARRVSSAIDARLSLPGDQTPVDALLADCAVNRAVLDEVVRLSAGGLQVIEHKGRSAVQKVTR